MSAIRENTLVIDFSVLPKRPDANAVQKFMYGKLKLELSDVVNIQFHNVRNVVFVEMVDAETAWQYRNNHHLKHGMVIDKQEFRIPVYVEDDAVNVRVHDLPPRLPNTVLKEHLQPFGDILSINREVWKKYFPGKYNGVRVVRMRLAKPIPSYQTIGGEKTLVTYRNQTKTCKHCGRKSHPRQKCSSGRTSTPNESSNSVTFAPTDFPDLSNGQPQQKQHQKQQQQEQQQKQKPQQKLEHRQTEANQQQDNDNNSEVECVESDSDDAQTCNNKRRLSSKSDENDQKRIAMCQGYQTDTQDGNNTDEKESDSSETWSPVVNRGKNKKK